MSSNVETSNVEIETSNVETSNLETIETTSNVETSNVETIETSNVETLETSNVETTTTLPSHEIRVVRFEIYPKDEPTCYCVGFSVTCNNRHIYRDTQVPLDQAAECGCETEIAQKAYDTLKESLATWIQQAAQKPSILGQTFVPN